MDMTISARAFATTASLATAFLALLLTSGCAGEAEQNVSGRVTLLVMMDAEDLTNAAATPPDCSARAFDVREVQVMDGAGKVLEVIDPRPAEAEFDGQWQCVASYKAEVPSADVYQVVVGRDGCEPKAVNRADLDQDGRLPDLWSMGAFRSVTEGESC